MEVSQEHQPGHGIKFLGWGTQFWAEMLGEIADGHQLEQDMSKDSLPAFDDQLLSRGRDDALEGVEQAFLSRVDGVNHIGRNSFRSDPISIHALQTQFNT